MNLNTLVTGAYLALGFNQNPKLDQVLDHWEGGHLEITSQLMRYAPFIEALESAARNIAQDYPGVYPYEVTEAFSFWYADQILLTEKDNVTPDELTAATWLRGATVKFFNGLSLSDETRGKLFAAVYATPFELAPEM